MKRASLTPAALTGLLAVYSALPRGSEVLLLLTHAARAAYAWLAAILALKASRMFEPGAASCACPLRVRNS